MIPTVLALLLACSGTDSLRYQDSMELLGINGDGVLVDARVTWGNEGLLAGQSELTFDLIQRRSEPVHYRQLALPERSTHEATSLVAADDSLEKEGDDWVINVNSEDLKARLTLEPRVQGAIPSAGDEAWQVSAPVMAGSLRGFWQAGSRGGLVDGRGLLTRRRGADAPGLRGVERLGVYVLGDDVSIGVDQTGAVLNAWALAGDLMLPTDDVVTTRTKRGFRIDLRPAIDLVVKVQVRNQRLRSGRWDHLTSLERWLLKAIIGRPVRNTRAATATVITEEGSPRSYPAMVVTVNYK